VRALPEMDGYGGFELDKMNICDMLLHISFAFHLDVGLDMYYSCSSFISFVCIAVAIII